MYVSGLSADSRGTFARGLSGISSLAAIDSALPVGADAVSEPVPPNHSRCYRPHGVESRPHCDGDSDRLAPSPSEQMGGEYGDGAGMCIKCQGLLGETHGGSPTTVPMEQGSTL